MHIPFIDIHTHNEDRDLSTFRILNRIVGTDEVNRDIVCTAGIHPWHIASDPTTQWELLQSLSDSPLVIGIGECGLDKLCPTDWDLQVDIFERQIRLANERDKPLIIHSVRAYQEIVQKLKEQKARVPIVFHGFNKKITLGEQLLAQGYYLSFGADILYGAQDDLIQRIPMNRLFLETDTKTTAIVDIFSYFCAARKISMSALKQQMADNLERVFNYSI